jgi:hypothetical protein
LSRNDREFGVQAGAEAIHYRGNRDGNTRDNKTILDSSRCGVVPQETPNQGPRHFRLLKSALAVVKQSIRPVSVPG